ncbi:MAG: hypothetical protein ACP5UT_16550 [Bryobacteraceae bacterium]
MASFRDRLDPELLHFPGRWRTRILIGAGLLVNALTALLCWWFESPAPRPLEAELGLLAALSLWMAACWPREILCGPAGVGQRQWLGLRRVRIPWDEVLAVEPYEEFGGAGKRFGIECSALRVVSNRHEIRHTPRHPDPDRFLRECRMRMKERALRQARMQQRGEIVRPQQEKAG